LQERKEDSKDCYGDARADCFVVVSHNAAAIDFQPFTIHIHHREFINISARVLIQRCTIPPTQRYITNKATTESHLFPSPRCGRHLLLYANWSTGLIGAQPAESHDNCPPSKQNRYHHLAVHTVPHDMSPQRPTSSQPSKTPLLRADQAHLGHPPRPQTPQHSRKLLSTTLILLQLPIQLPSSTFKAAVWRSTSTSTQPCDPLSRSGTHEAKCSRGREIITMLMKWQTEPRCLSGK
jgi:hypothetical protein